MLSFFKVIGNETVFSKLQLPQSIKIHNLFYINLLPKAFTYLLTNEVNKVPTPVLINKKKECNIKDILYTRSYWSKLEYQAKIIVWDKTKQWYDTIEFMNSMEIAENFRFSYLDKFRFRNLAVWHAKINEKKVKNWEFLPIIL